MFRPEEFLALEKMTNEEIQERIETALEMYAEHKDNYERLEQEMADECRLLKPSMDIIFRALRNVEAYIRKAENLLEVWDDNRYVNKERKNHDKFQMKVIKPVLKMRRVVI